MKKKLLILPLLAGMTLAGCDFGRKNKDEEPKVEFDFTVALESGKTSLSLGDSDKVVCSSTLTSDSVTRVYTYESANTSRMTVDENGYVVAVGAGSVKIKVTETNSNITKALELSVYEATKASGGFNYSSASGEDAINKRTEILGKLEKYAVESHLTGITLFENGGYVKYRDRLTIPASEYITGYGFGILSEGDIKSDLAAETVAKYKRYYHSAQTSDANKINAWNDTGSQVSDLSSYITSSYWGTKMNSTKDGYDWYPVLAADTIDGKPYTRPTPVYDTPNALGLYKTWKIYVKTGADGLKYRHPTKAAFDNKNVELDDYKFVYQLLLTGANGQTRGTEMAGDKTHGIKGAQAFYNRTKDMANQADIDNLWKVMTLTKADGTQDPANFKNQQLGILTGKDSKGSYIQLEILNEMDAFTAMYQLSSNLVSPIPRSFIEGLASSGTVKDGVLNYGVNSSAMGTSIVDNTINCGPYTLGVWNDSYLAFDRNDSWVEIKKYPNRHKIQGVKITTYPNASQEDLYMYYQQGLLDSCGVPVKYIKEEADKPDTRKTKGDSTFKLNVNSCTQERWNELFGPNGKISKNSAWDVKPWMSNDNFLNGLYWSINREEFATNKGAQPSIDYFSNAYLSDPENGVAYNDTAAHKEAVKKWHTTRTAGGVEVDDYGYNYSKAVECFKKAVTELAQKKAITYGTADKPSKIKIHIKWMYQTDIADYGAEIKTYFEKAFNDEAVCGKRVILEVEQDAVTKWDDVYNEYMMKGQFDLAFGAISGNTYSPLNFLEVLRSDNTSGFTLNWGPDTGKVDEKNPLIYDGHKWSFDALWEVSDRGGVVEDGVSVKTVKNYHFDGLPKKIDGGIETSDYSLGVTQDVNLEFVSLGGVEINITKVQVYAVGGGNTNVSSYSYDKSTKKLSITINSELGKSLKADMVELNNKGVNPGDAGYVADPFVRSKYGTYWTIEVYYSLAIAGGAPSESFITLVTSAAEQAK